MKARARASHVADTISMEAYYTLSFISIYVFVVEAETARHYSAVFCFFMVVVRSSTEYISRMLLVGYNCILFCFYFFRCSALSVLNCGGYGASGNIAFTVLYWTK